MAISTYKVFLMKASGGTYTKLIDIKDFPDLGGAPEMLETTTLSDKMQTYIPSERRYGQQGAVRQGIERTRCCEETASWEDDRG